MYKVFFNNIVLYFNKKLKTDIFPDVFYQYSSLKEKDEFISNLFINSENSKVFQIIDENIEKCWNDFCNRFKNITAAGGVIKNNNEEYLFIKRRGFWDLPKGKCEKNETIEKCAEREIEEECGIKNLILNCKITDTFHTYQLKNNWILKRTHWYLFTYRGNEIPVPEKEEDITEVKWVKKNDIINIISGTYLSIIDVLKASGLSWNIKGD